MFAGFCLDDGVLWVGAGKVTAVGDMQQAEEEERGSWAMSSSSPPLLTARVGAEGAWLDRGGVHARGYRVETNGSSDPHSKLDISRFLSARCSVKCPQEIQIRIF
jgi:hypothetical protein